MMRARWMAVAGVMAFGALAACGEQGGELREETERRRAMEKAGGAFQDDTTPARPVDDADRRLPAFVFADSQLVEADSPAAPPPAEPVDTPDASPESRAPWTVRRSRGGVRTAGVILRDVRLGVNEGFERVVLEFEGNRIPRYRIEYVDEPVYQCGSGDPLRVAGDGLLLVDVDGAQAHTETGRATVTPRERRVRLPVIQEVEITCDFEGQVQLAIGVASPNPYRVLELPDGRLVIDVRQ